MAGDLGNKYTFPVGFSLTSLHEQFPLPTASFLILSFKSLGRNHTYNRVGGGKSWQWIWKNKPGKAGICFQNTLSNSKCESLENNIFFFNKDFNSFPLSLWHKTQPPKSNHSEVYTYVRHGCVEIKPLATVSMSIRVAPDLLQLSAPPAPPGIWWCPSHGTRAPTACHWPSHNLKG